LLSHGFAVGIKILSGSSACRWYIDEDIPDINSFRARSVDHGYFVPPAIESPLHLLWIYVCSFLLAALEISLLR
jgi:hypothetical protein